MIKDITLRRLKDVAVKGNFSINCDSVEDFLSLRMFFNTNKDYISFKDIRNVQSSSYSSNWAGGKPNTSCKFIIKYDTLNELLKLREIFRTRAGKFDMRLIKKRGYDPFTPDFYVETTKPVGKVRK